MMRQSGLLFPSACTIALRQLADASPRKRLLRVRWLNGVLIAFLFSITAHAQPSDSSSLPIQPAPVQPAPVQPTPVQPTTEAPNNNQTPPSGEIDVSGGYSFDGYANWSGPSVRASFSPRNSFNRWSAGTARVQQFGETGQIFDGGIDRDLTNTWAGSLSISGSSAFFLPHLAVDVSASKRWFDHKKVLTTFSGSYVRWQDVHRDYRWGLGASYHFKRPWGVEAGVSIDLSTPTNQFTETQYVGVTYGSAKKRTVGLRGDFGRVAYEIIGPTTSISNLESYGVSLQLRQWVSGSCGFFVAGSYSYNSVYQSEGITMGIFKEFSGSRQSKQGSGR